MNVNSLDAKIANAVNKHTAEECMKITEYNGHYFFDSDKPHIEDVREARAALAYYYDRRHTDECAIRILRSERVRLQRAIAWLDGAMSTAGADRLYALLFVKAAARMSLEDYPL